MEKSQKRIIFLIIIFLIIDIIILIYIVNKKPDYNKKLYDEIYSEYEEIFKNESLSNTDDQIAESDHKEAVYIMENEEGKEYRVIGKIGIPKINVYSPIIYETTEELMKIGPTKLCGPNANEVGNFCIIGHNYRNDQFFSNLSKMNINDEIVIYNNNGKYLRYRIYSIYEVNENDVSCLDQKTNGNIELTLITCTKNKENRLILKCRNFSE